MAGTAPGTLINPLHTRRPSRRTGRVMVETSENGHFPEGVSPCIKTFHALISVYRTITESPPVSNYNSRTWNETVRRQEKRPARRGRHEEGPPSYTLEPLDPWLKCGPDTSVSELWKVVETRPALRTYHLVFLDQYGWYCLHGRDCPAVAEVQRVVREMTARIAARESTGRRNRSST